MTKKPWGYFTRGRGREDELSDRGTYHWPRTRKTHCHRGHPLSGDNLFTRERANGTIEHRCRACHAIYDKRRAQREKAARSRHRAKAEQAHDGR